MHQSQHSSLTRTIEYGRWRVCRPWWVHADYIGPPILIDRASGRMRPAVHNGLYRTEWEQQWAERRRRQDEALLRQHVRRLARRRQDGRLTDRDMRRPLREFVPLRAAALSTLFGFANAHSLSLFQPSGLANSSTIALDSNYVAGTSGDCIGTRYLAPSTKTLDTVYFFVSSYTGTAANVNDLSVELRPESGAGSGLPDTATLTEGETKDPASATGWIACSGFSSSITALSRVHICIGDADGNGTDHAVVLSRAALLDFQVVAAHQHNARFASSHTTTGWASGNTFNSAPAVLVLKFSDNSAFGVPFSAATAPANDTNRRGLRITSSAFSAALSLYGALWTGGAGNISGMEVWTGDTGPSGTADNVSTDLVYTGASHNSRNGCLTASGTPITLAAGTAYSIVATYSGNSTTGPQRIDIGTGEDATLRLAMPGQGNLYYRRANGTTDWSNDLVGSMPAMALLLDGQFSAKVDFSQILSGGAM